MFDNIFKIAQLEHASHDKSEQAQQQQAPTTTTSTNNTTKPAGIIKLGFKNSSALQPSSATTKKQPSLWEREEHTVKYLVEEGKVSTLVRLLYDVKQKQYDIAKGTLNVNVILFFIFT